MRCYEMGLYIMKIDALLLDRLQSSSVNLMLKLCICESAVSSTSTLSAERPTHCDVTSTIAPPLFLVLLLAEASSTRDYQVARSTLTVVTHTGALYTTSRQYPGVAILDFVREETHPGLERIVLQPGVDELDTIRLDALEGRVGLARLALPIRVRIAVRRDGGALASLSSGLGTSRGNRRGDGRGTILCYALLLSGANFVGIGG